MTATRSWIGAVATAFALAAALWPSRAGADGGVDLRVVRLEGILEPRAVNVLERATQDAARRGDALLLVVDSPGGDLDVAQKAMLTVLFAGVPVIAYVPEHGQAAGAALLPLMGTGLVTMAPTAHLGTRQGLGRFAASALGPFGERLFAAASEARSGSVDWMIVTLSDGGRIDARGAKRRGVAALIAKDLDTLVRALRGHTITVPLTGEVATLSGRRIEVGASLPVLASRPWRSPVALVGLFCAALVLLGLGVRRPSWGPLALVAFVALGVVMRGADAVPVWRPAILLCGGGALLFAAAAAFRRGALLVLLAAPCVALGARLFLDLGASGQYLDESAAVPSAFAIVFALACAVATIAVRRLSPAPETFRPVQVAAQGVDSPGARP